MSEQRHAIFADKDKSNMYGYHMSASQTKALRDMIEQEENLKMDYIDFAKKATDWKANNDEQANLLRMQNRKFYIAMVGLCAIPFRDGVNTRSVATSLGMYTAMCMFNKGFRKELGPEHLANKVLYPYLDKMAEKFPNSNFVQKRDKMRMKMAIETNNGRLPLTAETAAMNKIGWIEKAYDDMRAHPENATEIIEGYNKSVDLLNELCERDGVDYDEVNRLMSGMIAIRSDRNPNYYKYFAEFNNGEANMLYTVQTGKDENGNTVMYAQSQPQMRNGKLIYAMDRDGNPYSGGFSPRFPNSEADYAKMSYQYCKDYAGHFDNKPSEYGEQLSDMVFNFQQSQQADMFMDDHNFIYPDSNADEAYANLSNMTSEFAVATHAGLAVDTYDRAIDSCNVALADDARRVIIETYGGITSMASQKDNYDVPESILNAHQDFMSKCADKGVDPSVLTNIKANEDGTYDVPDETFAIAYEYCKQLSEYIPEQWFSHASAETVYEQSVQFEDKAYTSDKYGNVQHEDGSAAYGEDDRKAGKQSAGKKNDGHMPNGSDDYDFYFNGGNGPEPSPGGGF
jgi:hypothetical protein